MIRSGTNEAARFVLTRPEPRATALSWQRIAGTIGKRRRETRWGPFLGRKISDRAWLLWRPSGSLSNLRLAVAMEVVALRAA